MPKIRDWTWGYSTTIIAKSIVATPPSCEEGDLLVAICSTDTDTTQAWSATGWTQYFSQSNTTNLAILYKVAVANESNITFNYSKAETANVRVVSIMDADVVTPFNGFSSSNTSLARVAMPTVTTTKDNCLLLYCVANSAAGVPTIIEGAVTLEEGSDGYAHSDGLSWGFKAVAGTTPSDIYYTSISASASKLATIAVNPPATGASIIPPYCVSDASIYINPLHGTTAYNSNTAFADTATTYFSTTLEGNTLANGTVAAAADVGINAFHSMGQITGTTTGSTYSGATAVMATANKPNVSGKNVLVHIKPSTPKVLQTTNPITKNTAKGIAFGMCSTANSAYKVWHVHGAGTAWDSAQHVPVVINDQATNGLIQNTGTLDPSSILAFGFMISGFSVAPVWQFGSLWALDTTVVAGGNSAEPVKVDGINKVCSTGKERMSVLQQGATQALILQPIQFGDGGSNPINLNLDSTAIEFPQQYNVASRNVFYCSADNVAGLTYYAGAGDTIKHTNAVVSSKSKFHWRIHASSSASATYDFSGLAIIGAGDVQLRAVTTFDSMSFTSCSNIQHNSALITNSTFTGSYIYSNALGNISGCNFISSGTGHAIEVSVAGTYAFTGNTFSGYGANGTTDAAIYNKSGGVVTINISGGGDTPTVRNGVGSSTTVNNTINLTLTGLKDGSDIVILQAGTESQLADIQSNRSGTSYVYRYSTQQSIDVGVFKEGYVPFYIRGYSLGATDASLPIAQVVDRNFA